MELPGLKVDLNQLFPSQPDCFIEEERCQRDYEYLQETYPKDLRLISAYVSDYLDRYEYEGSMIYNEYPDVVGIWCMAGDIFSQFQFQGSNEELQRMKEIIQIMVCQEIYIRRQRHHRICRSFF